MEQGNGQGRLLGTASLLLALMLAQPPLVGCQGDQDRKLSLVEGSAAASSEVRPGTPPDPPPTVGAADPAAPPAPGAATGSGAAANEYPPSAVAPLSGALEPHRRTTVAPKIGGPVLQVHVREGDRVRAGSALVSLDPADIQLQLRQAETLFDAARIQYDQARQDAQRMVKLADSQQVSESQRELAETRVKATKAGMDQAQVAIDTARKALRDAVVVAPFGGVITRRLINEGERAMTMPATALVTIEETDVLDLRIQVPEGEMARVQAGTPLQIQFASIGRTVEAPVTRVVPSLDPRTRSFVALVELPNKDGQLRSGMFASVTIAGAAPVTAGSSTPTAPATPAR